MQFISINQNQWNKNHARDSKNHSIDQKNDGSMYHSSKKLTTTQSTECVQHMQLPVIDEENKQSLEMDISKNETAQETSQIQGKTTHTF